MSDHDDPEEVPGKSESSPGGTSPCNAERKDGGFDYSSYDGG